MIVNFDNAATTYPKPAGVRQAVERAVLTCGSAGRGGHPLAARSSAVVYAAREEAASLFGAQPEHAVLTSNCTHALNIAIQGICAGGGHVVVSHLEHNSVLRPVYALAREGRIRYSIARVSTNDAQTVENFSRCIRPDTVAVICTLCSNVTGQILPWREIASLCKARGICFIADGAQACGVLDVQLSDGINILCTAGHKGLYGITGTGLLVTDGQFELPPLLHGGSGSLSNLPEMPDMLPDRLEAGTLGVIGAASLTAGIRFVKRHGIGNIFAHESALCDRLIRLLRKKANVTVYREPEGHYAPIVSFNVAGMPCEEVAGKLAAHGFCLRAGLHCAPLAHHVLQSGGTVRFSPSVFSTMKDVERMALLL